ncbi:RHS repeat-associated core domain-containing protein [Pseudomonas sp. NPDC086251]|uniref:RHS repeat-associated core domain-containing protein n=1 Tax=Pseudomonas sp. NPDC086251 TaxID=3364431 RepID=UPI003836D163
MTQAKPVDQENIRRQRTVLLAVDLKNSVLAELDASNPNRMAYSPYGYQSAQRGGKTRLGFNGELLEMKPEWYLLGNGYRAYNTLFMRFHSPDSLSPFGKGGLNAYGYCGGEPVMNSDPTGQSILSVLKPFTEQLTNVVTKVVGSMASVTKKAVNSTASLIGSKMSGVSEALGRAKKSLIAITVGSEPFPVRPSVLVKSSAAHGELPSQFIPPWQPIKSARFSGQKPVSNFRYELASGDYHVRASHSARQHTPLLNKETGKIVAVVRTGISPPKSTIPAKVSK